MPNARGLLLRKRRAGLIEPVLPESDSEEEVSLPPPQQIRSRSGCGIAPFQNCQSSSESFTSSTHKTTDDENGGVEIIDESPQRPAQKPVEIEEITVPDTSSDDKDIEVLSTSQAPKQKQMPSKSFKRIDMSRTLVTMSSDDDEGDSECQPTSTTDSSCKTKSKTRKSTKSSAQEGSFKTGVHRKSRREDKSRHSIGTDTRKGKPTSESEFSRVELGIGNTSWLTSSTKNLMKMCDVFNSVTRNQKTRKTSRRSNGPASRQSRMSSN